MYVYRSESQSLCSILCCFILQDSFVTRTRDESWFICGDGLPEDTRLVVKRSINCSSPIENAYFSAPIYLPKVCVHCGLEENLLDDFDEYITEMMNSYSTVRPLCSVCRAKGKEAVTWSKKFFKKQKK